MLFWSAVAAAAPSPSPMPVSAAGLGCDRISAADCENIRMQRTTRWGLSSYWSENSVVTIPSATNRKRHYRLRRITAESLTS